MSVRYTVVSEPREIRGTGRTTQQIVEAPPGAIYVVPEFMRRHVTHIAMTNGRQDIRFMLASSVWPSLQGTARPVVVDHCLEFLDPIAHEMIDSANRRAAAQSERNKRTEDNEHVS
jgi:hypothetical protein